MYKIAIKEVINFNAKLMGFLVDVDFDGETAIIGCSLRDSWKNILDIPIRELVFKGECLWLIEKEKNLHGFHPSFQDGEIRFSIWDNDRFTTRLADTEWQKYKIEGENLCLRLEVVQKSDEVWLLSYNEALWKSLY